MKIKALLTFVIVVIIFSIVTPVQSVNVENKSVVVYDAIESRFQKIDIVFFDKKAYMDLEKLCFLGGYKYSVKNNLIQLKKGNRNVLIQNNKISYGSCSDNITLKEYQNKRYISLFPTIDYLNMRMDLAKNGLILYRSSYSYTDLVNDMVKTLENHYSKIPNVDVFSGTMSYVNQLIEFDLETLNIYSRLDEMIIRVLKEDDVQTIELDDTLDDLLSMGVSVASIIEDTGHFESISSYSLGSSLAEELLDKLGDITQITEKSLNTMNYTFRISNLYRKNIDNIKKVILNKKYSPYKSSTRTYKICKDYVDAYGNREKEIEKVREYITQELNMSLVESLAESIPIPSYIKVCFEVYKIFAGNKLNLFDYSEAIVFQNEFHNFQVVIEKQLNTYLEKIAKKKKLKDDEKEYFVYLSRLYFRISAAYYEYMQEADNKETYISGKENAQMMIDKIDGVDVSCFLYDNPKYNSSNIDDKQLYELKDNELLEKVTDEWANIYIDYFYDKNFQDFVSNETGQDFILFQMLDLDNNDIPEILVYRDSYFDDCYVYSINEDKKVYKAMEICSSSSSYVINGNVYTIDNLFRTSTEGIHNIYIGLDKVDEISSGKRDELGNANIYYKYYQYGNEISEEKFNNVLTSYNANTMFDEIKKSGIRKSEVKSFEGNCGRNIVGLVIQYYHKDMIQSIKDLMLKDGVDENIVDYFFFDFYGPLINEEQMNDKDNIYVQVYEDHPTHIVTKDIYMMNKTTKEVKKVDYY